MAKQQHCSVTDNALDTLDSRQLRKLVRELMPKLDEKTTTWLNKKLLKQASKNDPDWRPRPSQARVEQIEALCGPAKQNGTRYPKDLDIFFEEAMYAFQVKDYQATADFGRVTRPVFTA